MGLFFWADWQCSFRSGFLFRRHGSVGVCHPTLPALFTGQGNCADRPPSAGLHRGHPVRGHVCLLHEGVSIPALPLGSDLLRPHPNICGHYPRPTPKNLFLPLPDCRPALRARCGNY